MTKKLYAVSIMGTRVTMDGSIITSCPVAMEGASSKDEAIGAGIRLAKQRFPASDGWSQHTATICEIPHEYVVRYMKQFEQPVL